MKLTTITEPESAWKCVDVNYEELLGKEMQEADEIKMRDPIFGDLDDYIDFMRQAGNE